MIHGDNILSRLYGTPRHVQDLTAGTIAGAGAGYSIPLERGSLVRLTGTDGFNVKVVPEFLFGGYLGSPADGGVGSREANTNTIWGNVYDRPNRLWQSDAEGAELITFADNGIFDASNQTTARISLDKTRTDQSHVLEFALEDQTYLRIPLGVFPAQGGLRGRQMKMRGGQTGCIFWIRSIESNASYGLDWALKAVEDDDNAESYWNDTGGTWDGTIVWNALDDEVTLHTETLTFNTTTNDAVYELYLRSTDGATATGNTSKILGMGVHEPIEAAQGMRVPQAAGEVGPYFITMPYRGYLAVEADTDAQTIYIDVME